MSYVFYKYLQQQNLCVNTSKKLPNVICIFEIIKQDFQLAIAQVYWHSKFS